MHAGYAFFAVERNNFTGVETVLTFRIPLTCECLKDHSDFDPLDFLKIIYAETWQKLLVKESRGVSIGKP